MMQNDLAANYPALDTVYSSLTKLPPISSTYLAYLFDTGQPNEIKAVDEAVSRLLLTRQYLSLEAPLRNLFASTALSTQSAPTKRPSQDIGSKKWDNGATELIAYAYLEDQNLLEIVGFGGAGSSHFEGRILDPENKPATIAFDVKSGETDSLELLKEHLDNTLSDWASPKGYINLETELEILGSLPDDIANPTCTIYAGYRTKLATPCKSRFRTHKISIGQSVITVKSRSSNRVRCNVPFSQAEAVGNYILSHVVHKASHGKPFMLVYVCRFGHGRSNYAFNGFTDGIEEAEKQCNSTRSSEGRLWLGTLMLDYTRGTLERIASLRLGAEWPLGSPSNEIKARLAGPTGSIVV